MLRSLKIQNLILVEKAEISFGPGLNILTGETGSGKSAILTAIRLISGERAEAQMIRKGADLAVVEAVIGETIVRRELLRSGKSRGFIDDQQVSLAALREQVGSLVERIDQSSSLELCSLEEQRKALDAFAGHLPDVAALAESYTLEKTEEADLESLLAEQELRDRTLLFAKEDLAQIEETAWRQEEDEALAEEHTRLSHGQQLLEKLGGAAAVLFEGAHPLPLILKRHQAAVDQCVRFDPKLKTIAESLKSAALELEEAGHSLRSYLDRLEGDPNRLEAVEKRISAIESLKRRFGKTHADIEKKVKELKAQIDRLVHIDEEIIERKGRLSDLKKKNLSSADKISAVREKASRALAPKALEELRSLNLPHAQFAISLSPKPLTASGCDEVRFLFSANPGTPPIPLEQCASGGELSRLLLAIKTILAEKEGASCLVFDEIDSNVGGQTATILGKKLKKLSQKRQVICVTHFVQVARCATHHFLVSKSEKEGQALTAINLLSPADQEREFNRMLGK